MSTRERYFTSQEIAKKLNMTDRHTRRVAEQEGWDYKEVNNRGGKEKRFALSLLPESIKTKLISSTSLAVREDTPMNRLTLESYNREIAEARLTALQLFQEFHNKHGKSKDKALTDFVASWSEVASEKMLDVLPSFNKRTMYNWQSLHEQGGVIALAPNYGNRQGDTKLPEQYHELVLKAYLDQNKRFARSIYTHIIHQVALSKLGHEADFRELAEYKRELKTELSEYIVLNFIKNQASKGLCSKARGEKLEREKALSYIARDRSNLITNDIWVSDGHDANTFVIDEYGKVCRPVIVAWMDEKSRMVTGWAVDTTENTDLIITSLCHAVERSGVPKIVYIDNGKAYMNKRTSEKLQHEHRLTTYAMLGCSVTNARPYNAREKSIERLWGTLDNNFSKWISGYAGKNILAKPQKTELAIKNRQLLSIEIYKQFLEEWFKKYNTDVHTGEGMNNLSPYEVWQASLGSTVKQADTDTLTYMRLVFINELRSVAGGARVRVRNNIYMASELFDYIGEKVTVGLDPMNLDLAYIFIKGKLLCIAEAEVRADYTNTPKTQKAYRQDAKMKSGVKKLHKKIVEAQSYHSQVMLAEYVKAEELAQNALLPIAEKKKKVFDIYDYD